VALFGEIIHWVKMNTQVDGIQLDPQVLRGFVERLGVAIVATGLSQTEFGRRVRVSSGFMSDVARGNKKPGWDFLLSVRTVFNISIDWLLTGDGGMYGGAGIDADLLHTIRLQISLARAAIIERDPTANALVLLYRAGRFHEVAENFGLKNFLNELLLDQQDLGLAIELYNGHFWVTPPDVQGRMMLDAAMKHFEAHKPIDKTAELMRRGGSTQINIGVTQRIAGNNYEENKSR